MLNTSGVKAWRPDGPTQGRCLWEYHDVWRWDTTSNQAVILRENYFRRHPETGEKVRSLFSDTGILLKGSSAGLVHGFLLSFCQQMERTCTESIERVEAYLPRTDSK